MDSSDVNAMNFTREKVASVYNEILNGILARNPVIDVEMSIWLLVVPARSAVDVANIIPVARVLLIKQSVLTVNLI